VRVLDELVPEPGAFYVMDRGYVDFGRLHRFELAGAFFVTREKSGLQLSRLQSRPVDRGAGVRSDQVVWLTLPKSIEHYPDRFRRVSYRDPKEGKALVFLTNNFDLPALTIAQLYKCRWRVELFFKWIKQNLRIKHFFGTTDNAVKTQVWIAVCVYVLVAILTCESSTFSAALAIGFASPTIFTAGRADNFAPRRDCPRNQTSARPFLR